MINKKKEVKALKVIHDLIIKSRIFANENNPDSKIVSFLDDLEYLPALMLEREDQTDLFEEYLSDICEKYNCNDILIRYKT